MTATRKTNVESPIPSQARDAMTRPLPRASRQLRPDSYVLALEEPRVHRLERAVVLGAGLLVASALAWATLTQVPEVAVGQGEITPAVAAAPVQHLEGGIVAEVLVKEGDLIEVGQPLLRMNDTAVEAELAQARLRLESLQLQASRLEVAANAKIAVSEPSSTQSSGLAPNAPASGEAFSTLSFTVGPFAEPQRAALNSRLRALADRAAVFQEQVEQRRNDVATLGGQVAALREQVSLYEKELGIREELARNGLTTRLAVLEAQRLLMTARAEHDRLSGQYSSSKRSLAEAEARIIELQSAAVDEARQEAARVALEVAETAETVRKLKDRSKRTLLLAPISGVLRGLAVHRQGTVLQPGSLIAEIMPQDAPLVADVRLLPRDIGFIEVGQPVHLKVQAFDYTRFGTVEGKVERVSAGTFVDEQRQPYYRARIALSQQYVGRARLVPGMTVQADITTGTKTVLQYLLKPIYSAMTTSFHER